MNWKTEPPEQSEGTPLHKWDWTEIARLERLVRVRMQYLDKCSVCGQPMMLGQRDRHFTCRNADGIR